MILYKFFTKVNLFLMKGKILKYKFLSTNQKIYGNRKVSIQPILYMGNGTIKFGNNIQIGVIQSPNFHSGYCYLDARNHDSKISINDNCRINNNFTIISEGEGVFIGKGCLIGENVSIYDSDFHSINPKQRFGGKAKTGKVVIGDNVFIGSDVIILKGVTIGENSVIAAGSIVAKDISSNVIAGGNPCRLLKEIER